MKLRHFAFLFGVLAISFFAIIPIFVSAHASPLSVREVSNSSIVRGTISQVSGTTFVVTPTNGSAVTVSFDSTTRLISNVPPVVQSKGTVPHISNTPSASNLTVGESVLVIGTHTSKNTIHASIVHTFPASEFSSTKKVSLDTLLSEQKHHKNGKNK